MKLLVYLVKTKNRKRTIENKKKNRVFHKKTTNRKGNTR